MRYLSRLLAVVATLAIAACTAPPDSGSSFTPSPGAGYPGWPPAAASELIPVPVSTEIAVGPNRLLVNLLDSGNQSIADPNTKVNLSLYDLAADPSRSAFETTTAYLPTIEGRPGLYRAQVDFGRAGDWGLEAIAFEADGSQRTGRMVLSVREAGSTPAIGASVPASETPTAQDASGIAAISTDDDPDPDFYTTSIADAMVAHQSFAVVFATPAFCRSATCGPTLDLVKSVAADYKGRLTFIHAEPYQLQLVDGHLQPVLTPDNLPIPVESVNEWGLPTEPYVFVVDGNGQLVAKFEGIASVEELRAAFDEVAQ